MNKFIPITIIGSLIFTSCFKDEAANSECDITEAYVHVNNPSEMFFNATDTLVNVLYTANDIQFNVRRKADLTVLSPRFTITPGATISPANGSTHDFSNGSVMYTVTSEDGEWSRKYNVSFIPVIHTTRDTIEYDFENASLDASSKYYVWSERHEDGNLYQDWASGNEGWGFTAQTALPEDYPTTPIDNGYEGKGVKLVTKSTGAWGHISHKPMAAGNLFLGTFDMRPALTFPRKATGFGLPFDKKPKVLSGYYKYKPGEIFMNQDESTDEEKVDQASIYAILYRNHDSEGNPVVLDGDNIQTSPLIVAKAIVNTIPPTDEWREFYADFEFIEPLEEDILDSRGYSLAIVFSSSAEGAYFQGALGSTLCIDKVRIACETTE